METQSTNPGICPNCQTSLQGQFCFACGQNQKSIDRHFATLVTEFFDDIFAPNSKSARTLFAISFKPGFLTSEYFSGRKARYIPPIRLYLTTSIIFFFLVSVLGIGTGPISSEDEAGNNITIDSDDAVTFDIEWPGLSQENSSAINLQLQAQFDKALELIQNDPKQVRDMAIDAAPPVIFCLVPLFALLLKLIYFRSGRFYTEHLVLALHNHSFLFLALLSETLLDHFFSGAVSDWLELPIDIWIVIYLFLSLKHTYQEGLAWTCAKFLLLGLLYWCLFIVAVVTAGIIGVLTL